jgi:outer membrane lipoprotein-sorting protein
MMFRAFVAGLIASLFMSAPSRALAQDPVMDVVKKMKEVFEPVRPSTRTVDITMTEGGETIHWVAREAMKQFPDGKRMVMVMVEPAEVKGNAYLIWEPTDKPSVVWTYLPFLRRVRELLGVDAYEHFLGTDFTYADLGFVRLHPQYRLLGEEDHGGQTTYKIEESVPQERAYYSRVITWVSKDSLLPVQRDYYDVAGTLWKTEVFEEETIDGVPTPIRIQMKDLQGKSSTELRVSDVRYNVEVPDALFDPVKLSAAASSPVWQGAIAQATQSQE